MRIQLPFTAGLTVLTVACAPSHARTVLPTLTLTPDMRVDANTNNLSAISWMAVARNGTIAVLQPGDQRIVFFDSLGDLAGTFGRKGSGPGEFGSTANCGWLGDTLWVNDFGNSRTTLIAPDLKLIRSIPFGPTVTTAQGDTVGRPDVFGLVPSAMYSDGSTLADIEPAKRPEPSWYPIDHNRMALVRATPAGTFRELVGYVPTDDACMTPVQDGTVYNWFCARTSTSFALDGSHVAIITQTIPTSPTAEYHVTMLRANGDTAFSRTFSAPAMKLPKHSADSIIDAHAQRIPAAFAAAMRAFPIPDYWAPVRQALANDDGSVWVELYAPREAPHAWVIIDPSGKTTASWTSPASTNPMVIAGDQVWGTVVDSDGLESVVRFQIAGARR